MTPSKPNVFVVDDDPAVLKAVSRLLQSNGLAVSTFDSARQFLDGHDGNAHGCLLLDIEMPELSGLELQQELRDRGGELPIIFLTGRGDIPKSVRAMKQGAVDFLTKPADESDLIRCVRGALEKEQANRQGRAERAEIRRRVDTLTPREREVLEQVIAGKLNKETAAELGTVEKTIKVHRAHIMEKMQVSSVAELVRMAERVGIAPVSTLGD